MKNSLHNQIQVHTPNISPPAPLTRWDTHGVHPNIGRFQPPLSWLRHIQIWWKSICRLDMIHIEIKVKKKHKVFINLTLFCAILVWIPSLVHSTFSIVYWISLAAGISFQVLRNVFFSMLPSQEHNQSTGRRNLRPTFLTEEDVYRSQTREVEDVETILDGDLNIGQRLHLLNWPSRRHWNRHVKGLTSIQHRDIETLRRYQIKDLFDV